MAKINNTSSRLVIELGGSYIEVKGLHKEIEIERPEGRELPTCTAVVYNMTPDNVRALQKDAGKVVVYASIDDVEHTMFVGNVASVVAEYAGVDLRTEIMISDARNSMATKVKLSYPAGKSIASIVRDVCGQAGMSVNTVAAPFDKLTLDSSFAYSGTARRALDQLTRRTDGIWRVQGGQVSLGTKESLSRRTGLRYTANTGMIGSPRLLDGGRIGLDAILSPQISNGSIIQIQSVFVDAWCRVESHVHYFGPDNEVWSTSMEAKEI